MASTKRNQHNSLPGWAWMMIGLCIGLSVALFVYLEANQVRLSDSLRALTNDASTPDNAQLRASESQPAASDQTQQAAENSPESEQPSLSFYTRLRDSEVIVPGAAPASNADSRVPETSDLPLPESVELQAGSFPTLQGADTRQASLALLGITSRIDQAVVDNTRHYRVIIGPLTERGDLSRISGRLDREEIEYFRRRVTVTD